MKTFWMLVLIQAYPGPTEFERPFGVFATEEACQEAGRSTLDVDLWAMDEDGNRPSRGHYLFTCRPGEGVDFSEPR